MSTGSMKRDPRFRRGLPSLLLSPCVGSAPGRLATIRSIWRNASGSLKACARRGCRRDDVTWRSLASDRPEVLSFVREGPAGVDKRENWVTGLDVGPNKPQKAVAYPGD